MAYPFSPCDLGSQEFMWKSPSHPPPFPDAQKVILSATALPKGKRSRRCHLHGSSSELEPELPIPKSLEVSSHAAFSSNLSKEELEQQEVAARCLLMMSTCKSASSTTFKSRADLVASSVPEPLRRRIKKPRLEDAENHTASAAATTARTGPVRVYKCKSCRKGFLSFEALGGHRVTCQNKLRAAINKAKPHECPVCQNFSFWTGPWQWQPSPDSLHARCNCNTNCNGRDYWDLYLSSSSRPPSSSSTPSATKMMELDSL